MKKCRKYLTLIYRELDGIITDKEKIKLAAHIEKCNNCMEEYKIITEIKAEFANEDLKPLPDNFNKVLHKKLVDANLSIEKRTSFSWRVFGNVTATACVALAITLFAVNSVPELEKAKDIEITRIGNDIANQTQIVEEIPSKKAVTETKERSLIPSIPNTEEKNQSAEADDSVSNDTVMPNDYSLSVSSELQENLSPLRITVAAGTDIQGLIPYAEQNEDGTFKVPANKLEETKELLKEFILTVENEILNCEYFIIKY